MIIKNWKELNLPSYVDYGSLAGGDKFIIFKKMGPNLKQLHSLGKIKTRDALLIGEILVQKLEEIHAKGFVLKTLHFEDVRFINEIEDNEMPLSNKLVITSLGISKAEEDVL